MIMDDKFKTLPRHIYRCGGELQAGTSVLAGACVRRNICNGFLNPSYILSGEGLYIDAAGRELPFGPGTLLIRHPWMLHHQRHEEGIYIDKFFVLPASFGHVLTARNLLQTERPLIELGLHSWIRDRFDALADELGTRREDELALSMGNMFLFLTELLLLESRRQPHYAGVMAGMALLERDPERRITPKEVAEQIGMTYANFRRLFTRYVGIPPGEYRIRKRMEKIQAFLRNNDVTLKETAERFGYPDLYTFARQFKAYTGITPGAFRRGGNGEVAAR